MIKQELKNNEFDTYYENYIYKLPENLTLIEGFINCKKNTKNFFSEIPEEKWNYSYEIGKWTIKELFQHLIDTERIFIYRCFRIARRDITNLTGFNQDEYIVPSNAKQKTIEELFEEFTSTRNNSISILKSLPAKNLSFIGNCNGSKMSARAAAFIILGHYKWHLDIIKTRYLT